MSEQPTPSERYRKPLQEALGERCEECGQENGLEIHHKDGDSSNSDLDNLELLCGACHNREHYDTVSNNDATNDIDIESLRC
ncbi:MULTISPECIES: HNH endonuclease signature motif containing protein [Haloferacaceae]|uniref:HNH endonuclease signature motif containing protein n=1 Tax=Halorubrum glutamatedens TaxID=2707018 RepID=A0ABD5QTA7_9EURY